MPFKDAEKQKAYLRRYQKRLRRTEPEEVAKRKHLLYQAQLEKERKKNEARNRARGHKPRVRGPKAKREVVVSASKRYRIFGAEIYFTSRRGFSAAELRAILKDLADKLKGTV